MSRLSIWGSCRLIALVFLLVACDQSLIDTTSPTITTFSATPQEIIKGQSTTLHWNVESNQPVAVRLNGTEYSDRDSLVITPNVDVAFRLSAANSVEEVVQDLVVRVNPVADIANGIYSLQSASIDLCLEIAEDYDDIVLTDCHFEASQQWMINKTSGSYTFEVQRSNKLMHEVLSTQVQQHSVANSISGNWYIAQTPTAYKIISKENNNCLGVKTIEQVNKPQLLLSECLDTETQLFKFKKNLAGFKQEIQASEHKGDWSEKIEFPIVPVAASLLPNNKVLMWSSFDALRFGGRNGYTKTMLYDLTSGQIQEEEVTLGHDMFCPGISMLANGDVLVNGGSDNFATSIYKSQNNLWSQSGNMNIGRGYNSTVTLNSGDVFTLGGSWGSVAPTVQEKVGELWTSRTQQWQTLAGANTQPLIDATDPEYDNHPQLFSAPNGNVFLAGPSPKLAWYDPSENGGDGEVISAGLRADDSHSQVGITAMYDVGKILKAGGASRYTANAEASNKSYTIDINDPDNVTVTKVSPMIYPRAFASSVVLPDGQVLVTGGATVAKTFDDSTAVMIPELWNPKTGNWRELEAHNIPRTYHSVALLLPDARVLVAGGGLCGDCGVNHPDGEVLSPPYLFEDDTDLAIRPEITSAPSNLQYEEQFLVSGTQGIKQFTLVRVSSVTHGVNTDQRFIKLNGVLEEKGKYSLKAPKQNVAPPGNWMLFALDDKGVPSIAKIINISDK